MTHIQTKLGRRTVRVTIVAALAALTMALVPAAADAHRLSQRKANQFRNAAAQQLAAQLDGAVFTNGVNQITLHVENALVGRCTRRSAHRFTCPIGAEGTAVYDDGFTERFLCTSRATVRFRNNRSRRVTGSYTEPQCGPAPSSSSLSRRPSDAWRPAG